MKILIVSKIYPNHIQPEFGSFVKYEASGLAKQHAVRVIAPVPWFPPIKIREKWYQFSKIKSHEIIDNISVSHPRFVVTPKIGRIFYGHSYWLGIKAVVNKIWSEFQFDIILAHYAYPDGFACVKIGEKFQRPVILKIHGSDINVDLKYFSRRLGCMQALKRAQKILSVDGSLKEKMVSAGIAAEKIKVITNGADTDIFRPMDKAACRRKLRLSQNAKYILFVGNLVKIKGIFTLLQAFRNVNTLMPETKLLIIGEGDLQEQLSKAIIKHSLVDSVSLLGGKPHQEIPYWMNASDVFCLSSLNEGCPIVLLEAKACGLRMVATNVGGVRDIITAPEIGIVVPPARSDLLANALVKILKQKNCEKNFRSKFNVKNKKMVNEELNREIESTAADYFRRR